LKGKGAIIKHVGTEVFTGIENPNHSIILQFKILKPIGTFFVCFLYPQAKQSIMHVKKSQQLIYFLSVHILFGKVLLIIMQF
jgi:hypothetical protein